MAGRAQDEGRNDGSTAATGTAYLHDQASASAVWTITHNLGFRPNIQAFDSAGDEASGGTIVHVSANQLTVTWSAAFGGKAYLS